MKKQLFTLLTLLLTVCSGAWGAVNNTTVTKAGGTQKYIDVSSTAASEGDEVTVSGRYIAYTCAELVANTIKGVWYTQGSSGSGSNNSDAVSITGYRSSCNKYLPVKSGNTQTFYVTNCVSFSMLYDPRSSGRYLTITATNMDDNTDTKTITNSGTVSSGTKYNVELTGLDASKYYKVEVVTNATSDSRFFQVRLEAEVETYTVTYKANNGTEEADVTDDAASTVAGCSGTWTVPSGKIFSGWNTAADGSGTAYAVGASVTSDLTLYAQWGNSATLFSMTSITSTGGSLESQTTADVTATFSTGGSAQVFQNASGDMLYNNSINLNGSGASYIHVFFPTKLQVGDIVSATFLGGAWKIGTTTSSGNAVSKDTSFTIETGDALIGATDFYIFKDGSAQITAINITGLAEASDLVVTSSKAVNMNVGATSTITKTTSSDGAITYTSSDTGVATVSSEGVITGVSGGTATITINQAANGDYRAGVAKVTVTVNETAIIKAKLTGNGTATVTGTIGGSYSGLTQAISSDYGGCKLGSNGHYAGVILASGNTFNTGDVVEVKITYGGGGKFIFYDDKDQTNILLETDITPAAGTYRFVLPATADGETSLFLVRGAKDSGKNEGFNPFVDYIAVYRPDAVVTLNASGYATYSNSSDFTFDGAQAYKMALNLGAGTLVGTEVTGKIPAGEGILLKGDASAAVAITNTTGASAIAGNNLHGTTASGGATVSVPDGKTIYVLSGNTFKRYTGTTFAANKAFFQADGDTVESSVFTITFDDENGETTSIKGVEAQKFMENNKFYNLNGQEVQNPTKGLYIVNGKKVIVK